MASFALADKVTVNIPSDYDSQRPKPFYVDPIIDGRVGEVSEVIPPDAQYGDRSYDIKFAEIQMSHGLPFAYAQVVPENWLVKS